MTARRSWFRSRATPRSALELDGAKVCVQKGTTSEQNVKDFFDANHVTYEIVEGDTVAEIVTNYLSGKCNTLTTDESQLFALRSQFPKPGDHMILPDVISKEPLGPVVRQDDMQWFNIVKWMNYALIDAEEQGVSSKTIDEALQSQKPGVKRLVGTEGDLGKPLGLSNAWAANAIRAVGNYGEIFDRNVGAHTKLGDPARPERTVGQRRHPVRPGRAVSRNGRPTRKPSSDLGSCRCGSAPARRSQAAPEWAEAEPLAGSSSERPSSAPAAGPR